MSQSSPSYASVAKHARWYDRWGHFLAGVFIGLLLIAPVLATPIAPALSDETPTLSSLVDTALAQIVAIPLIASMLAQRLNARRARDARPYR